MSLRSERLKKLEAELSDLKQWLKLGLVPKKDISKHTEEISTIEQKIGDERERLRFLKENDEVEGFVAPKRSPMKTAYPDAATMTDVNMGQDTQDGGSYEFDTESVEFDTVLGTRENASDDDETESETEEDTNPFSDRARWKRGWDQNVVVDPDSDEW